MTAEERLAAAIASQGMTGVMDGSEAEARELANVFLAVDPDLRTALTLGLAWQEAEAALAHPEQSILELRRYPDGSCMAFACDEETETGEGATPTEALTNLAALLRATEGEKP